MNKNSQIVIINGSARKNGNSSRLIKELKNFIVCDQIDLIDHHIGHFDYDFDNQDDDFLGLMKSIISQYQVLVLCTPIYWYSMSGHMKVFFDRISDLLKIQKELGRKLRGKHMAVISNSGDDNVKNGFYMPFEETAKYLGMGYLGEEHIIMQDDKEMEDSMIPRLKNFKTKIKNI